MKYALVTGASRGIGQAIAKKLAATGIPVVVNYLNNVNAAQTVIQDITDAGGTAELLPFDASNPQAIDAAIDAWEQAHPDDYISVLVNNAGIRRDEICIRGIPDVLRGLFPHDSDHGDDRSFPHDLRASDGAVRRSFCPDRAVLVAAPGEHLPADRRHREQDSSVQEPLMLKTETGYREPQAASGC